MYAVNVASVGAPSGLTTDANVATRSPAETPRRAATANPVYGRRPRSEKKPRGTRHDRPTARTDGRTRMMLQTRFGLRDEREWVSVYTRATPIVGIDVTHVCIYIYIYIIYNIYGIKVRSTLTVHFSRRKCHNRGPHSGRVLEEKKKKLLKIHRTKTEPRKKFARKTKTDYIGEIYIINDL